MGIHAIRQLKQHEPDYAQFERIALSLRLPEADEFTCTDEEVREAWADLRDFDGCGGLSEGTPD